MEYDDVRGVYDLILNNYGPDNYNGSVHIEVPDYYTADQIDQLVREIQVKVYEELDVILTAIGVYAYNTQNLEATEARKEVMKIAKSYKNVLQVHGFYLDEKEKTIRFAPREDLPRVPMSHSWYSLPFFFGRIPS